ncbi:Pleckstrin y domain-containing family M member 1 [Amphibalanus amphitrite]|uniref:Pleckstrin y domain-containing family M member 1 n=1 Tax=Amphibalanus amphitrite TaxID=1232801 RepID=A0A6A4X0C0_AMPAM|nr:Pleckstrin y domain-containing family M member 1 [Amphibalanus amphitrite]
MDELENLFHLFDSQKKDLLRLVKICSKPLGPEEVHYFLTSMDKICSHGLKNEKLGYWPFVKEFTHKAGVTYIADMKGCVTGPGKSRAWLLLALSEGTLEFYFTSFIGHPAQRARYYRREAFLRDDRRLRELVLGLAELMAVQFSTVLRPEEYDLDKHVCPPPNASEDGEFVSWTERDIEQEISQGRRRKRAAHSALVEIDHCKAVQLMVSFFEGDEMAYTGFKVLFGDHHAMRTCLLVLTSYRLLLLRLSTYRRLRRAARRRPRPADPLSQLAPGAEGQMAQIEVETESCPYLQDAAFQYCSIASIKVAFHGQAVALQRPDGSYSRWIWLCDRAETDLLISHITRAFQRCRLRPLVPQVYTSEAHRHQYLREIGYREREAEIQYASLVYFEDFAVPGETPKLSDQLMYKTDAEPRWSVGHFVLWDTDLLVYPSAAAERGGGAPLDRWPLPSMASCRRLTELSRPHQLQLAAPGRWLTLAAPDADTCSRWAATVREIIELNVPSQLPSPRPRCCVLTGRSLYVVEEMAFTRSVAPGFELCPYGHLVQACGSLRDLGAVNADSHGTVHVEFDTAEAAESMGSWRLYFVTLTEQRAFLAALLDTYRKRCKRELTVGQISHHMREVCLSGSRYVRTRWDGLVDT